MRPCPLCNSPGVEHPAGPMSFASASCSNPECILHSIHQDDTNRHVLLEQWEMRADKPRGRVQPASAKIEAFYRDALTAIAKIAREKYGDEPKVLHMIAALSKAVGMMVCACFPNERDLARETAVVNLDDAIKRYAAGEPSPMSKQ